MRPHFKMSQMNISAYLSGLLNDLRNFTPAFNSFGTDGPQLIDALFSRVTSSRFRRSRVNAELEADIRKKISAHIVASTPISFTIPFGAYKQWDLPSYPETDWAEFLNICYMGRFASSIAAVYEPGVLLQYTYGDAVMDTVSNMPRSDTDRYLRWRRT